jgi:hypothetical protein
MRPSLMRLSFKKALTYHKKAKSYEEWVSRKLCLMQLRLIKAFFMKTEFLEVCDLWKLCLGRPSLCKLHVFWSCVLWRLCLTKAVFYEGCFLEKAVSCEGRVSWSWGLLRLSLKQSMFYTSCVWWRLCLMKLFLMKAVSNMKAMSSEGCALWNVSPSACFTTLRILVSYIPLCLCL